jgi:hypothetical protein
MLKRLLRPLLEPIAAKLEKLLDRTSEGFKKQQQRNSEARQKQRERMNMLSRQIDDSRDEIIRGFARQEAKLAAMKKQIDQVLVRLNKLSVIPAANATVGAISPDQNIPGTSVDAQDATPSDQQTANPFAEMMLDAGDRWLASQAEDQGKA